MAEYSGERELLGTGVVKEAHRATGGALPPDSPARDELDDAHDHAAWLRRKAEAERTPGTDTAADPVEPGDHPPAPRQEPAEAGEQPPAEPAADAEHHEG